MNRLLEEGNPELLMKKYGHSNLEDVFLDLCRNFKSNKQVDASVSVYAFI